MEGGEQRRSNGRHSVVVPVQFVFFGPLFVIRIGFSQFVELGLQGFGKAEIIASIRARKEGERKVKSYLYRVVNLRTRQKERDVGT